MPKWAPEAALQVPTLHTSQRAAAAAVPVDWLLKDKQDNYRAASLAVAC